jgi:hypothetical protein
MAEPSLEFGADAASRRSYRPLLEATLEYGRERSYCGPDYGDGMSSRLLRALPVESKWLNLLVQETVKRAPVNLRPLFLVETRRNYMGIALFSMANAVAADLTGEERFDRSARDLADWLVEHRIEDRAGFCGGHRHDLQTLDGVVRVGTPGIVGTSYAVKALLWADRRYDEDYAAVVRDAADFLFEDLGYETVAEGARIDYKPGEPDEYDTLNAIALGARMLSDLYDHFGERRHRRGARELLRYVASCQTDRGGWHYREPPSASHLSMDSHHNGFVIEAFQRYRAVTGSGEFDDILDAALSFYRDTLFGSDGAPNFDEESAYPRDVHAASQGVLVWSYEGDVAFASRILEWTLQHLYAGDGRFYFRKHRYHTKRVVLMRWCVAWMAYAVGVLERARCGDHSM